MATFLCEKTADDLAATTGLTVAAAKQCFDRFGGYAPALASFVQSIAEIPSEMFADRTKHTADAKKINIELRAIYEHARKIMSETKCDAASAWKQFYKYPAPTSHTAASLPAPETIASAQKAAPAAASFGFGPSVATAAASITATPAIFGFGAAQPSSVAAPTAAPPASFAFSSAKPAQAAPATVSEGADTTPANSSTRAVSAKYVEKPSHFTGCYFDMKNFWEKEVVAKATLLNLDGGFLERNRSVLSERVRKWLKPAEFYLTTPVKYVAMEDKDEYYARVIIKDAERTFFDEEHREKLYMFLYAMYFEFGNYGQAMSYLAGICLLVLNEQETAAVLRKVSTSYIPGHWAAEAVGFATSAWVVERFLKQHFPDVAAHFMKLNFWPDTYLQKILSGLCIHVLRFDDLFHFLDCFMEKGFVYLVQFSLAIIEHFRDHLLRVDSSLKINELYEIMRLDSRVVDRSDVSKILQRASTFVLHDAGNIDVLRSEVYQEKVAPRIQRAPKVEAFEPCELCEKNRPAWWSDDLGAVCEQCKALHKDATFTPY